MDLKQCPTDAKKFWLTDAKILARKIKKFWPTNLKLCLMDATILADGIRSWHILAVDCTVKDEPIVAYVFEMKPHYGTWGTCPTDKLA